MFIMASIIHLGKSGLPKTAVTEDDLDRLGTSIKLLAEHCPLAVDIFLAKCRHSLDVMLEAQHAEKKESEKAAEAGGEAAIQACVVPYLIRLIYSEFEPPR